MDDGIEESTCGADLDTASGIVMSKAPSSKRGDMMRGRMERDSFKPNVGVLKRSIAAKCLLYNYTIVRSVNSLMRDCWFWRNLQKQQHPSMEPGLCIVVAVLDTKGFSALS